MRNMDQVKNYYQEEVKGTVRDIHQTRHDFLFALLTDSHLDGLLSSTVDHIASVDQQVSFDCIIHLGDFLTGNITKSYTRQLLDIQMEMVRNAVKNHTLYPVQGNHDGFMDNAGTTTTDIALDEDWYDATSFVDGYPHVSRPDKKAYFYVDYPQQKLRLIILNSQYYEEYDGTKPFRKRYGFHPQQLSWLAQEALPAESGWTVIFFSHDAPYSETYTTLANSVAILDIIQNAIENQHITVAAWFVGDHHGELIKKTRDIHFILVGSQTAYVPQLWHMTDGGFFCPRQLGAVTEDLWDAVALDIQARKLLLFRFGAGEDRVIYY